MLMAQVKWMTTVGWTVNATVLEWHGSKCLTDCLGHHSIAAN